MTKVVIPGAKQAYLQAGIRPGTTFEASLGEIGYFCSLLRTLLSLLLTFTHFYATFVTFTGYSGPGSPGMTTFAAFSGPGSPGMTTFAGYWAQEAQE